MSFFSDGPPLKTDDLFIAVVSSPLPVLPSPPSNVVCPVLFLNSAAKINFIRVSPLPAPRMVSPGRSAPAPTAPPPW